MWLLETEPIIKILIIYWLDTETIYGISGDCAFMLDL
jgi:hypothetical protein